MGAVSYVDATPEEIGEWVHLTRQAIDSGTSVYSNWYLVFFRDIEMQYLTWKASDAPGFPLSPKQLTYLHIMVEQLAKEVLVHAKNRELNIDRIED